MLLFSAVRNAGAIAIRRNFTELFACGSSRVAGGIWQRAANSCRKISFGAARAIKNNKLTALSAVKLGAGLVLAGPVLSGVTGIRYVKNEYPFPAPRVPNCRVRQSDA